MRVAPPRYNYKNKFQLSKPNQEIENDHCDFKLQHDLRIHTTDPPSSVPRDELEVICLVIMISSF